MTFEKRGEFQRVFYALVTMNMLSLCGFATVLLIIMASLKKYSKIFYLVLVIVSGVVFTGYILNSTIPLFEKMHSLTSSSGIPPEYTSTLFKSLGICLVSQFTADACKDAGETALAGKIELASKIAIATLSLPILEQIIASTTKILGVN